MADYETQTENEKSPEMVPLAGSADAGFAKAPAAREGRLRGFLRGMMRWLISLFVAFVAGVLLIFLLVYLPARQELDKTSSALKTAQATLEALSQDAAGLEEKLSALEAENTSMKASSEAARLHVEVAKALAEARDARLYLALLDKDGARLSLQALAQSLDEIAGLATEEYQEIADNMKQSVMEARSNLSAISGRLQTAPQPILDALEQLIDHLEKMEATLP